MGKRQREVPSSSDSWTWGAASSTGTNAPKKTPTATTAVASPTIVERLTGLSTNTFLSEYHEKKSHHQKRDNPRFFHPTTAGSVHDDDDEHAASAAQASKVEGFPVDWSTTRMKEAVAGGELHFSTDINIVRFDKDAQKRVPLRTDGVVTSEALTTAMASGWSVRFLRPHEHIASLSAIIAEMEGFFGCYCGANSYWTPAGSQGFAPHYDDVDVFLLQLEGEKRWRIYDPPKPEDKLARISSEDYQQPSLPAPKADFTLKAGEALYMPRGTVHQGVTPDHTHSLHITFSAFQMHTYTDFLKALVNRHLECVSRSDLEFREALPLHWNQVLGAVNNSKLRHEELELEPHSPTPAAQRKEMLSEIRRRLTVVSHTLARLDAEMIDLSVDSFAAEMISKRQPLPPKPRIIAVSAATPASAKTQTLSPGQVEQLSDEAILKLRVQVRDPSCCRMILKDEEVDVVHCGDNSPICLASPMATLRFDRAFAPAIATLLTAPKTGRGIEVASLPMPEFEEEEGDAQSNRIILIRTLLPSLMLESFVV